MGRRSRGYKVNMRTGWQFCDFKQCMGYEAMEVQGYGALGVERWLEYGQSRDALQVTETQTAENRTESPERSEGFYHETWAVPEASQDGP